MSATAPSRGFYPQRIFRAILFLSFTGVVAYLAATRGLDSIVHPRTHLWIFIGAALALFLAGVELLSVREAVSTPLGAYVAFFLVLGGGLAYVALPPGGPGTQFDVYEAARQARERDRKAAEAAIAAGSVNLEGEAYWPLYQVLFDAPEKAKGVRIRTTGYVYHRRDLPQGSFLVARNLMWCCAADLGTVGIVTLTSGLGDFPEATWVAVEGVLDSATLDMSGNGESFPVPVIKAKAIVPIPPPQNGTIFPQ